jgi:putative selenate reductase
LAKAPLNINMSDKMIPVDFPVLLENIIAEYNTKKTIYDVPIKIIDKKVSYKNGFMEIEMPFGPAAGPHTQLAQNIAAGYAGGARFFELKTVQVIDGESLHINKPCINVPDEGYNIEWSTEITIEQALDEYVKAYFLLRFMAVEFGLGKSDGFSFNMSVGYDLQGIKSHKVNTFIDQMKNAAPTLIYRKCYQYLEHNLTRYSRFSVSDLKIMNKSIADSITVSTMHGCPADEIEKIAEYLMTAKKVPVYIKLNPTLNGLAETQKILADKGYGYIRLVETQFTHDLQLGEAVAMLERLLKKAEALHVFFGVKLTNTLPVEADGHFQDKQMYLSGKPLFLLALSVARKLANEFGDTLPMSFSGGLDGHNIAAMLKTGIHPLTMATVLLKSRGYRYLAEYADIIAGIGKFPVRPEFGKIDRFMQLSLQDSYYTKKKSNLPKKKDKLPMLNCKNCSLCIAVCPNRANIALYTGDKFQIVHIDAYCNECGNCANYCPYIGKPYRNKFTVFSSLAEYNASESNGIIKNQDEIKIRVCKEVEPADSADCQNLIQAVKHSVLRCKKDDENG